MTLTCVGEEECTICGKWPAKGPHASCHAFRRDEMRRQESENALSRSRAFWSLSAICLSSSADRDGGQPGGGSRYSKPSGSVLSWSSAIWKLTLSLVVSSPSTFSSAFGLRLLPASLNAVIPNHEKDNTQIMGR